MSGCPGCLQSLREQQQRLDSVRNEAKKFAAEQGQAVYLYVDFQGNVNYVLASAAATADVQRMVDIVTPI